MKKFISASLLLAMVFVMTSAGDVHEEAFTKYCGPVQEIPYSNTITFVDSEGRTRTYTETCTKWVQACTEYDANGFPNVTVETIGTFCPSMI